MYCFFRICARIKIVSDHIGSKGRRIQLDRTWSKRLEDEFGLDYMVNLRKFLIREKRSGKKIFPPGHEIFNALNCTKFEDTKAVILGQDPYHGAGQAHGFCFSVKRGIDIPPSLQNIYKELQSDVGFTPPDHGCLRFWAEQGVLLLNAVLTVEESKAASHQDRGWEIFTNRIIEVINNEKQGVVFLLWGSYAQRKGTIIQRGRHLVLQSPHPSPLSAHRGFFGSRHFSKVNEYLISQGKKPINWQLPNYS